MIIVKQNKEDIVNFSRVAEIKINDYVAQKEVLEDKLGDIFASILKANVGIDNTKLSGYAIYAYFEKDNFTILGKYKTMKRAKEVLAEIVQKYSSYLQLTGGPAIMQGQMDIQPNIFNIPKTYEMPED